MGLKTRAVCTNPYTLTDSYSNAVYKVIKLSSVSSLVYVVLRLNFFRFAEALFFRCGWENTVTFRHRR